VSVIVPSIGRDPGLPELLDALAAQTFPREAFEILVALSGEPPTHRVHESAARAGARLIAIGAARGPGAARNAAARGARGEWLAFTEDDCMPPADWLAAAMARVDAEPALDVLAGETRKPGGHPVHREKGGHPLYLPTNLFVRRAVFEKLGGYCEDFFDAESGIYFREDSDFGFTLEECGARVAMLDAGPVIHPEEHPRPADALTWARRHLMDPLLRRRHPRLFRERIEVHKLGPLPVHRPVANASQTVVGALALAVIAALLRSPLLLALAMFAAIGGWLVVWSKWRFRPLFLGPALLVPFVLTAALVRGAQRAARLASAKRPD